MEAGSKLVSCPAPPTQKGGGAGHETNLDPASIFQAGIQKRGGPGALFPAYCIQATKSAGVHSFLPIVRAANSIENTF